jgi:hypothetical protein
VPENDIWQRGISSWVMIICLFQLEDCSRTALNTDRNSRVTLHNLVSIQRRKYARSIGWQACWPQTAHHIMAQNLVYIQISHCNCIQQGSISRAETPLNEEKDVEEISHSSKTQNRVGLSQHTRGYINVFAVIFHISFALMLIFFCRY